MCQVGDTVDVKLWVKSTSSTQTFPQPSFTETVAAAEMGRVLGAVGFGEPRPLAQYSVVVLILKGDAEKQIGPSQWPKVSKSLILLKLTRSRASKWGISMDFVARDFKSCRSLSRRYGMVEFPDLIPDQVQVASPVKNHSVRGAMVGGMLGGMSGMAASSLVNSQFWLIIIWTSLFSDETI